MSFLDSVKEKFEAIGEKIAQKYQSLPEDHFLKRTVRSAKEKFEATRNKLIEKYQKEALKNPDVALAAFDKLSGKDQASPHILPKPIIPQQPEKQSVKWLKEKLGPEKWAKRAEKIKKTLEKLTIHAANFSTKLLIWGTKLAGKTVKWSGRAVKATGYGIRAVAVTGRIASWGLEYLGKGLKWIGKGLEAGGKALTQALSGSKIGVIFTPFTYAITALGVGTKGLGIGTEKTGQAGKNAFKKLDDAGKNVIKTGDNMVKTGKKMENTADRMDKIRKHYKAKLLAKTNQNSSNTATRDQQRNMMRIKNPLAFEEMNAPKKKVAKTTASPNIAIVAQNKKRQK